MAVLGVLFLTLSIGVAAACWRRGYTLRNRGQLTESYPINQLLNMGLMLVLILPQALRLGSFGSPGLGGTDTWTWIWSGILLGGAAWAAWVLTHRASALRSVATTTDVRDAVTGVISERSLDVESKDGDRWVLAQGGRIRVESPGLTRWGTSVVFDDTDAIPGFWELRGAIRDRLDARGTELAWLGPSYYAMSALSVLWGIFIGVGPLLI